MFAIPVHHDAGGTSVATCRAHGVEVDIGKTGNVCSVKMKGGRSMSEMKFILYVDRVARDLHARIENFDLEQRFAQLKARSGSKITTLARTIVRAINGESSTRRRHRRTSGHNHQRPRTAVLAHHHR